MYWLLKQYEDFGRRQFTLEELRPLLGLDKNQYQQYSDFRKRVLNPCQQDLSKLDMAFDYQEVRKGRAVRSVIFTFGHLRSQKKQRLKHASPSGPAQRQPQPGSPQMSLELEEGSSYSRYDQLLNRYGFSSSEISQLKELSGESGYNRTVYFFETNLLPNIHPKDVRVELLKHFYVNQQPSQTS